MSALKWIGYEAVILIHDNEIARTGGLMGIRDHGLILSAIEQPKHHYHYSKPKLSVPELAAIYAYGLAMNPAFFDANKRTSLVVSLTFLDINGYELKSDQIQNYLTFRFLGAGEISKDELISWFNSQAISLD